MWKYVQSTGEMFRPDGKLTGVGYSGNGDYKNQPEYQCVRNQGPIPRGTYRIEARSNRHISKGPLVLPLTPDAGNEMCRRSGFLIHGDSKNDPGGASNGCIILNRTARAEIDLSGDKKLVVVRASLLSHRRTKVKRRSP